MMTLNQIVWVNCNEDNFGLTLTFLWNNSESNFIRDTHLSSIGLKHMFFDITENKYSKELHGLSNGKKNALY